MYYKDYKGLVPQYGSKITTTNMEYNDFIKLPLEKRKELFYTMQADYGIVLDLIKDRNNFKRAYNILYSQLRELEITPKYDYYKGANND